MQPCVMMEMKGIAGCTWAQCTETDNVERENHSLATKVIVLVTVTMITEDNNRPISHPKHQFDVESCDEKKRHRIESLI